jgi:hypothetical protein
MLFGGEDRRLLCSLDNIDARGDELDGIEI